MAQRRAAGASSPTPARPGPGPAGPAARRTGWRAGRPARLPSPAPPRGGPRRPRRGPVPACSAARVSSPVGARLLGVRDLGSFSVDGASGHSRGSPRRGRQGSAAHGGPRVEGMFPVTRHLASLGLGRPQTLGGRLREGRDSRVTIPCVTISLRSPLGHRPDEGGPPPNVQGPPNSSVGAAGLRAVVAGRQRPGPGRATAEVAKQRQAERPGDRRRCGWVVARLGSGGTRGTPVEAYEACITVPSGRSLGAVEILVSRKSSSMNTAALVHAATYSLELTAVLEDVVDDPAEEGDVRAAPEQLAEGRPRPDARPDPHGASRSAVWSVAAMPGPRRAKRRPVAGLPQPSRSRRSAERAASWPHIPCTPPPGGVEAEHR